MEAGEDPIPGHVEETFVVAGPPSSLPTGGLAAYFGVGGSSVVNEIDALLPESKGQLGQVAGCIDQGVIELREIVDAGAAANPGAAANLIVNIRAIRNGEIPQDAPSRARLALGATRSFLKQHSDLLSPEAREHLKSVVGQLLDAVDDPAAIAREEAELHEKGEQLEDALAAQGGVYVYTFPHYFGSPAGSVGFTLLVRGGWGSSRRGREGRGR